MKDEEEDPNKPKPVPVYKLVSINRCFKSFTHFLLLSQFRYATNFDKFLIITSVIFSILNGIALPVAMYLFGDLTNLFANHDASRTVFETIRVSYYNTYSMYNFEDRNLSLSEAIDNMMVTPGLVANQELLFQFNNASGLNDILNDASLNQGISCAVISYANDSIDGLDTPYKVIQRLATDGDYMFMVTSNACSRCLSAQFEEFNEEARCLSDDTFFRGLGGVDGIFWQLGLYGIITVATFITAFFQISTMQLACERQVYKIRLAYYRAVLHQDIGWFDLNASGELTSRLNE